MNLEISNIAIHRLIKVLRTSNILLLVLLTNIEVFVLKIK